YTVHWGDGSTDTYTTAGAKTHVYADGPNAYTITADLTDEDGTFANAGSKAITVNNVAPTISFGGATQVNEGATYTLTLGAVTDPEQDTVATDTVHWGDGTTDTFSTAGDKTHTYADGPNSYTISVDLTDEDGTFAGAGSKLVNVLNVAPTIAVSGANSVNEG